jgi:hypothetical protein
MALTEEQLRKFDEMVNSVATDGNEIRTLLSTAKSQPKEIEVYGVKLKVLPTIPRKLRHELAKFDKIQDDLESTEQHIYYIMSQICVEEPFNRPEAWEYLDEKGGMVPEIMKEAFNLAYDVEKKIKNFR